MGYVRWMYNRIKDIASFVWNDLRVIVYAGITFLVGIIVFAIIYHYVLNKEHPYLMILLLPVILFEITYSIYKEEKPKGG